MCARRRNPGRQSGLNLLDLRPVRLVDHDMTPDGRAVLLRPKFTWGPLKRYLLPRLPSPFFRVTLDEMGTFVWLRCDGRKPVSEIIEEMSDHFRDKLTGQPMEQAVERLRLFLNQLCNGKMLRLEE